MSNFIISSAGNNHASYISQKIEAGYKLSANLKEKLFNLSAFHKLAINNDNFLKIDQDFVCVTGTLIYKNVIGKNMLYELYSDYNDNIPEIRHNSLGAYCIIIKKGDTITIFGEENYSYNIYYYIKDNEWIISNSFLDIQSNSEDILEIDNHNFLEFVFNTYVLDNETIFKDVKRLCGEEYITINLINCQAIINKLDIDWKLNANDSYQECINNLTSNLNRVTKAFCESFGNPILCMTGGLDSRMSLASILKNGYEPNLLYGVGNSILTDTKDMDLTINKMYSKLFNLKLEVADWSTPSPIDKSWDLYLKRYSESFLQYNASPAVLDSFEKLKGNFITFGYFGEYYRNIPWIENLGKEYFSLEEYLDKYFYKNIGFDILVASSDIDVHAFKDRLLKKLKKLCVRYSLNPERIHINDYRYIYIEYLRVGESIMLNLINKIRYCSYFLSEDIIYKNCSLSVNDNKGAKFMLDCFEALFPKILSVPFFTHCEIRTYNAKTKRLNPPRSEKYKTITSKLNIFKPLIPLKVKLWITRTFVNKDNKAFEDESRNKTLVATIYKYMDNQNVVKIKFKPIVHRRSINLSMMLFALGKHKSEQK